MGEGTPEELLAIEFPKDHEMISVPVFDVCIEPVGNVKNIEISIDGQSWRRCRYAVGFWWFEWSGYQSGHHQIVCRGRTQNESLFVTPPRRFWVDLRPQEAPNVTRSLEASRQV